MHITFLIGNGFDINLGMNTRYCDFYKHYAKLPDSNILITNLKKNINENYDTWADLELQLGEHTNELLTDSDFDVVYEDIQNALADYISSEEEKKSFENDKHKQKLINDLCNSENYLLTADKQRVTRFKSKFSSDLYINIITFNYTNTLEKILGFSDGLQPKLISKTSSGRNVYINNIKHVHGYSRNRMVLGVNDISQIKNQSFRDKTNVIDALVKPECNKVQKHLVDQACIDIINYSNLFCLFGLSIGETDKFWWKHIAKRLKVSDTAMIIYYRDRDILLPNQGYKIGRKEKEIIELIKSRVEPDIVNVENIIIGHNTKLFDIGDVSSDNIKESFQRITINS